MAEMVFAFVWENTLFKRISKTLFESLEKILILEPKHPLTNKRSYTIIVIDKDEVYNSQSTAKKHLTNFHTSTHCLLESMHQHTLLHHLFCSRPSIRAVKPTSSDMSTTSKKNSNIVLFFLNIYPRWTNEPTLLTQLKFFRVYLD